VPQTIAPAGTRARACSDSQSLPDCEFFSWGNILTYRDTMQEMCFEDVNLDYLGGKAFPSLLVLPSSGSSAAPRRVVPANEAFGPTTFFGTSL
jgi:hypothetical protein